MIVNWKKENAGALVVPLMKDGVVVGKRTLIPGYNNIPDDEWEQMQDSMARKIEAGQLTKVTVKKKVAKAAAPAAVEGADDPEYIPYNDVVKALKELGLFEQLTEEKKAEDEGNGSLTKKWLKERFEKEPELRVKVFAQIAATGSGAPSEEILEVDSSVTLKELSAEKAIDIIVETFSVDTLTEWLKGEGRDEVRASLSNQIEELRKEPTKEKKGIFGRKK